MVRRLQRIKEIEASGEDTLAFIFESDDPDARARHEERGRAWQREQRVERSKTLTQALEKIQGIRDEAELGATTERRASYEKWDQYIQEFR